MLRSCGSSPVTSRPYKTIEPSLKGSRPAMQARAVLLPQPEGPRKVTNSPSAILRSSPLTAVNSPKRLVSCCRATLANGTPLLPLERAGEHAAHEIALERERDHHGRDHRQHRGREHRPVVEEAELDQEPGDDHRDGLRLGRPGQDQREDELVP